jgi:hypothetical protein
MSIQLTPEVEAGIRSSAAARGMDVDALITKAVSAYLRETPSSPQVSQTSGRDRSAEMAWADHPDPHYLGKWVVLEGSRVVASDSDPKRLYEEVLAQGISSPFLIFISPNPDEPFAGGWID